MTNEACQWFDPADLGCKAPYGAVPSGQRVRFTLRPLRSRAFIKATLITQWEFDNWRTEELDLPWVGLDGERDLFSAELETDGYTGLVWYSLRLERWDGAREGSDAFQLTVYDGTDEVPTWFGEGVSYQIFPDRFCRLSVPDPAGMVGRRTVHRDWGEEPEYRPDSRGEIRNRDFFGGSLKGIQSKLDYLEGLGVETLYLCPIFEAPENHRYGVADYEKIDPMLGTEEDFVALCKDAHSRGMHVMLDGVFNHTGFVSKYFNGDGSYPNLGAHQSPDSPYYTWFDFQQWPDRYTSWWGIYSMPTTNKMSREWQEYITGEKGIIRKWLRLGADGWRLDVADELPDFVVHDIHEAARAEKPDAVIIGEVWEDASTKIAYDVRRRHVLGRHCDSVMNYPLKNALLGYLLGDDAANFKDCIEQLRQNYPPFAFHSAMNSLGTHDTIRAITLLGTGGDGKDHDRDWRAHTRMDPLQHRRGVARLKLGSLALYAFPGSPTVYYGDEAGLEGYEDPFNRRTFPWGAEDQELEGWFAALGQLRKTTPALRRGELRWLRCGGRILSFTRELEGEVILCALNAGDHPAILAYDEDRRIRLEPMTGRLLHVTEDELEDLI